MWRQGSIALCMLVIATSARANPLDTFGFGSRTTAMGSAGAADVHDFSASYYNPAGLARAKALEISIGYFRADHSLAINGKDSGVDPVKGLVGGVVAPGELFGLPFAFGLALHLPDDRLSRVRALPQQQPRWELYDNRNQRLYFAANIAISPWDWLQLGGGLSFMSSTEGRLDITGNADILKPADSALRHEVDADLTAIRYPQLGARVALGKRAAVALVYRGEFRLNLDLSARLAGDISLGASGGALTTALYALETHAVDAFLPQQVVLGGSWDPTDDLRIDTDLTWINWSAYISPVAALHVNLDIPPPSGGWPPNVTPPQAPAPTAVVPIAMHDRVVPHLGVEWRAIAKTHWEGFLRAGGEVEKSPIPAQTGLTNYVDRDRYTAAGGVGVRFMKLLRELPGDLRLDAHVQWSVLPTEVTHKASPADLVGDYTAGGHIWNVGGTMTVGF